MKLFAISSYISCTMYSVYTSTGQAWSSDHLINNSSTSALKTWQPVEDCLLPNISSTCNSCDLVGPTASETWYWSRMDEIYQSDRSIITQGKDVRKKVWGWFYMGKDETMNMLHKKCGHIEIQHWPINCLSAVLVGKKLYWHFA